jgi:hypothetical protein
MRRVSNLGDDAGPQVLMRLRALRKECCQTSVLRHVEINHLSDVGLIDGVTNDLN